MAPATSPNLIATASDFVSVDANDYHLVSDSSLIDRGITLSGVTIDRDGKPRPKGTGYEVGAYEYEPDGGAGLPIATDDFFSVIEDSGATSLAVLNNDTTDPGETLAILSVTRPDGPKMH